MPLYIDTCTFAKSQFLMNCPMYNNTTTNYSTWSGRLRLDEQRTCYKDDSDVGPDY